MKPIIRVEGLSKEYRIGALAAPYSTLRESLMAGIRAPLKSFGRNGRNVDTVWALRDVSFEVMPGEVVGIIGRNGAGKSTLLKILSRITEPSAGEVDLYGRVGSLLEVGTGFHPELTGRENIYLNGAILGMKRQEIKRKFDEIVAFAEIEKFLDTPVKRYSSGMYLRLAFAVAAHLEPEILVVDEVLAVGDTAFQRRCFRKMDEVSRTGRTVLVVSHNLAAIRTLCRRAILLEQGRLIDEGETSLQVSRYLARLAEFSEVPLQNRADRHGNDSARITHLHFRALHGQVVEHAFCGSPLQIVVGYRSSRIGASAIVELSCWSTEGQKIFHLDNFIQGTDLAPMSPAGQYVCKVSKLPLSPGRYHINVLLRVNEEVADHIYSAAMLDVLPGDFYQTGRATAAVGGLVFIDHEWV